MGDLIVKLIVRNHEYFSIFNIIFRLKRVAYLKEKVGIFSLRLALI